MSLTGGAPPMFPDNEKFYGTNWITWSKNILIAACMRGAYGYLTGTIKKPPSTSSTSTITTKLTTTLTEKETTSPTLVLVTSTPIETRWQSLTPSEDEWDSRDNWVRGLLLYNTKNPVGLGIKTRGTTTESWASYVERYEVSIKMARLAAEQDLKNTTYSER